MFRYKIDVLQALKEKGYSTYTLKKNNLIGGSAIYQLSTGKIVGINVLESVCTMLECQPSEIIEWIPAKEQ